MQAADVLRVSLNLVLALGQLAATFLMFRGGGFDTLAAKGPVAAERDLATPAGYAFTIWFVIYLGCIAYAVVQALPANWESELFRRIGWLTALGFAGCIAWLIVARHGPSFMTIPIIWIMLLAIGSAFLLALRTPPADAASRWIVLPLLAMYAGWLTAAAVLNVSNVLPQYGVSIFGLSGVALALASLAAITTLALGGTVLARGDWVYVGTLGWALVAVAVANLARGSTSVAIAAATALVLVLALAVAVRGSAPISASVP